LKDLLRRFWTKGYFLVLIFIWTLLIILSTFWNIYQSKRETLEKARVEARAIFEHTLAYRRLNALHGGFYVPIETNPPNPYLITPHRDVVTAEGIKLTLMNPFRMTKQAYDILKKQSPLAALNRTVSLKPLNPENEPDEWERKALLEFEKDKKEVTELTEIEGEPYMRVMKPYMTEERCLGCHRVQGYKAGDVRGGMSIAVPMKPYFAGAIAMEKSIISTHLVLWALGAVVLFFLMRVLRNMEERLFQARKLESLGKFAGSVAHDFNSTLTAITGFAHMLKTDLNEKDAMLTECAEQILVASKLGKNLTSNLLAFGRRQIRNPKPVSLNSVLDNIADILKMLVSEDIRLRFVLSKSELPVFADTHQLEQLVLNLCTNARDAMPGRGELVISTSFVLLDKPYKGKYSTVPPDAYMTFSVSDTGSGIRKEDLEHIFEPFFTTKDASHGTGLGLSIVGDIVAEHRGHIDVRSEPGKGTSFRIFLPVINKKPEEAPGAGPGNTDPNGDKRILLVEDDPLAGRFLESFLRKEGYSVISARDGEEGVAKYMERDAPIDLLILDAALPRKNGKEVFETIKGETPGIKALFISGFSEGIIPPGWTAEQGLELIPKPLDLEIFINKVRELSRGPNSPA